MGGSLTIGRIGGIPIRIHFTWLFILALLTWSLATGYYPENYVLWDPAVYWLTALASALLFFGAVLVHELSHSFLARARGLPVESITLFVFGGVSSIQEEARSPGAEFWISIVGPLTSLVIAGICYAINQVVHGLPAPVEAVIGYLAVVNLLVGIFNLIPGFPLDGGRVLRSIVWAINRNLVAATRIATGVGRGIAFLMIFGGIFLALNGGGLSALWISFIGWFLDNAAVTANQQTEARSLLGGVRVRDAMRTQFSWVPVDLSVAELVDSYIRSGHQRGFPVYNDGRLAGIVTLTDVAHLARERWFETPVGAIMTPREKLRTTSSDAPLEQVLPELLEGGVKQLLVIDGDPDRVLGILARSDVMNFLQVRQELAARR